MQELDWQVALREAVSDPIELCRQLALNPDELFPRPDAKNTFKLRVPHSFIARMERGNPKDPLLLQVLPTLDENRNFPEFSNDPLNEKKFNFIPGLLHKYHGRVLITLSPSCAVNCRYCFRRHFPYNQNNPGKSGWDAIFSYLKNNATITEVILSGGDPLMIKDVTLSGFIEQIEKIPTIKKLRFHTRFPIVIPSRITREFISLIKSTRLLTSIVFHINHPNEINDDLSIAFEKLRQTKAILLNQSVLLKNINDQAEILIALSERLFQSGILPYYLHLLDAVQGAAHFQVEENKAKIIWTEIAKRLPGYLVPRLVREVPDSPSKCWLLP